MLNTAAALERQGFRVTVLEVDGDGLVDPGGDRARPSPPTPSWSPSSMPTRRSAPCRTSPPSRRSAGRREVLFHTDATHTFTRLPLDVGKLPVDLVTVAGHTIHGPKGVGGLYIRTGTPLGQVDGRRLPGVQPAGRCGGHPRRGRLRRGGRAGDRRRERDGCMALRDRLLDRALAEIPHTTLNGHRTSPSAAERQHHLPLRGGRVHHAAAGHARLRGQHRLGLFQQVAGGQPRDHGHRRRPRAGARVGAVQSRPLQHQSRTSTAWSRPSPKWSENCGRSAR